MKHTLTASILAITLLSAGATALAHERYPESGYYRDRGVEYSRYQTPEVLYDRYGNAVYATRAHRYVAPVEERCHREPVVVVPECHRAPVVPECHRVQGRLQFPLPGPLRFIFGR